MRRLNGLVGVLVLVAAALCAGDALALTDEEIFRAFDFNFANPGARSVGLGGAYIAAADDATAAQANPAALHYLSRMEFFLEYRSFQPETTTDHPAPTGSLTPFPSGVVLPYLDITNVSEPEDTNNVSFVSFVYPFKVGKDTRLRLAFSRQVVLDANTSLSNANATSEVTFAAPSFPSWVDPLGHVQQYAVTDKASGTLDAQIIYYNLGFSSSITRDFSIGATGTWATLDMQSSTQGTIEDPRGLLHFVNPREVLGDGNFAPVVTTTSIDGTDSNFAWALGVHWHPDSVFPGGYSPIRFGVVYHKGAKFSVDEVTTESSVQADPIPNVLKVPDRYGIGVSYEFGGGKTRPWLASLDVERIQFSDLLEGFAQNVNFFTKSNFLTDILGPTDPATISYTVDNATVYHFGLEYNNVSRGGWTQAVRVGYYNDPDTRIRMSAFDSNNQDVKNLYLDVFSGGSDQNHYAVGFSVGRSPARGQSLTFQFAGDFSDTSDVYVGSLLWRFGKRGQ